MKLFTFIILFSSTCLFGQDFSDNMIDFDKKSSNKYLKKHKILTARLNQVFNFGGLKNTSDNIIWLYDISSNFTTSSYSQKTFGLGVTNESLIFNWLKEHKLERIYFLMNEQTGIPELIGYSMKGNKPKIRKALIDKEKIELTDFTYTDMSTLDLADYVVGWLDFSPNSIYSLFFNKKITLIYPTGLTEEQQTHEDPIMKKNTFMGSYPLLKPLSVNLAETIAKNQEMGFNGERLVLKRIGDHFEIVGYTRKKIK